MLTPETFRWRFPLAVWASLRLSALAALLAIGGVACSDDDDDDDTSANDDDDDDDDDDDTESSCGADADICIEPGPDALSQAQEALINAQEGDVVAFAAGTFEFDDTLSVDGIANLTVRGMGREETLLDFSGQAGAEGIFTNGADNLVIADLSVFDTAGDGIKSIDSEGVTYRNVHVEWTGGPAEENGSYGLYPVMSRRVLIEDCAVIGASDAGIYVGQSDTIIVRRSRAEYNVAGIEIENSKNADVYENTATNNAGGLLVFDLPELPVQGGENIRLFDNDIYENNTANFAPAGNIVGLVPAGTGAFIMANDNVEVFDNRFRDNQTVNFAVISYEIANVLGGFPLNDPDYDPFPEAIFVHDNTFQGGGNDPQEQVGLVLKTIIDPPFPDLLWDGITHPDYEGILPADKNICFKDNGDADFGNIDAGHFPDSVPSFDITPHICEHDPLPGVDF